MEIAQELDIDYLGSAHQFFDSLALRKVEKEHCRKPYHQGFLEYDYLTAEHEGFTEASNGNLLLWTNLDAHGNVPADREYVIGADVAMGTLDPKHQQGASNSCLSVVDRTTGEKVAAFATSTMPPHEFAKVAVALCRFFKGQSGRGAHLIWEANGPGRLFERGVLDLGYMNFYLRRDEKSLNKKVSPIPGWWSVRETKLLLLGNYRKALQGGQFINRDRESILECEYYVYLPNGSVAHNTSVSTPDPSGARDNHGDRVIADALAWKVVADGVKFNKKPTHLCPLNSVAGRRKQREQRERARTEY